ncbi:MAG: class I SAM-dependent methyltransferase [Actinomycetota bacterium]
MSDDTCDVTGSLTFDRAAEYYDRTRGFTEEGHRRSIELLTAELRDRGRVLEIGVGTGQIALSLQAHGIDVLGVDLSMPMMEEAVSKPGGERLGLVQGDATRLPFADGSVGAAYFRWVFHLIPRWQTATTELARVVRQGGVIIASQGGYSGPRLEVQEHFAARAGVPTDPVGLHWGDWAGLDAAMEGVGAHGRALPTFLDIERDGLPLFLDALERGLYSWTWTLPAEARHEAADETRAWAMARFGPLEAVPLPTFEVIWRAYDLPMGSGTGTPD